MPAKKPRPTYKERYDSWFQQFGYSEQFERRDKRVGRVAHQLRARERGYPTLHQFLELSPHNYISLLSFRPPEALQTLRELLDQCPDPEAEVCGLLSELDWRYHTPAVAAYLLGIDTPKTSAALWEAADCASWASPQLLVAAFLRDPLFLQRATERLRAGFPINPVRVQDLSPVEVHISAGPTGSSFTDVSAKAANALVVCCQALPDLPKELADLIASEAVQALLAQDTWDHGDRIAQDFLSAVQTAL